MVQWYERVLPCAESMSSSRALGRIFKILEARVSFMSLSDGAARLNVPDRGLVARTDVATEGHWHQQTRKIVLQRCAPMCHV